MGCLVVAGLASACGDDDNDSGSDGSGSSPTASAAPTTRAQTPSDGGAAGTSIDVSLQEFSILPDADSAAAGPLTFHVTNNGQDHEHEFVIIRTDLAPEALPTGSDESVSEDEVDAVDEVEGLQPGESGDVTVDLDAGSYVFICNVVEDISGQQESHYQLGMRRGFTVQ
jgi:uncharacterized cupredoxin-like copper-binding protein